MKQRNFGLDLVRAIAIIAVVHGHSLHLLAGIIDRQTKQLIRLPIDGVSLFFTLSGYLIGGILIRVIEKEDGKFGVRELMYFWHRRWMRTLPIYYFVLTVAIFVKSPDLGFVGYLQRYTFTFNLFDASFPFYFESWSLSVEEWFYLSLPILILLIMKVSKSPRAAVLSAAILLVLFSTLVRVYYGISMTTVTGQDYGIFFRKAVVTRLDSIAFGVLMIFVMHHYGAVWKKFRFYIIAVAVIGWRLAMLTDTPLVDDVYDEVLVFTCEGIFFALMLPLAEKLRRPPKIIDAVVTHISVTSYSMYLIHLTLVMDFIRDRFLDKTNLANAIGCVGAYWISIFVISTLLYRLVEKPFMDMRK